MPPSLSKESSSYAAGITEYFSINRPILQRWGKVRQRKPVTHSDIHENNKAASFNSCKRLQQGHNLLYPIYGSHIKHQHTGKGYKGLLTGASTVLSPPSRGTAVLELCHYVTYTTATSMFSTDTSSSYNRHKLH